jgi:hypothetical protein
LTKRISEPFIDSASDIDIHNDDHLFVLVSFKQRTLFSDTKPIDAVFNLQHVFYMGKIAQLR